MAEAASGPFLCRVPISSRIAGALLCALSASSAESQPRPSSDLRLSAPISTWDEAIPLGNGLFGGLVWGGESRINISLDRGDLWDLRPAAPFGSDGYRFADVVRLVREHREDSLHIRLDDPYDRIAYPTKIPGGRVVVTVDSSRRAQAFTLSLAHAEASVQFAHDVMRGFFSARDSVALFRVPSLRAVDIVRPASLNTLGYGPATFSHDTVRGVAHQWMVQQAALGLSYVVAVASRQDGPSSSLMAITIATSNDGGDPVSIARRRLDRALRSGYAALQRPHDGWWQRFWATTASMTVPDTALQAHLDLVQYYYGAAARRGAPPIPLQGVWTADGNSLPPWKGDIHNDLNTQMTYLAAHAAGADDAMMGWLDYNWKLLPVYRQFARDYFGVSGAAIPGVMSLDGKPLGGWGQYSLSPSMGLWVAQSFYLQWRYGRDRTFLRTRAYPFIAELGTATTALLQRAPDGRWRLPLSSSPEIFDNSMRAWLPSMSNFDLALLHWLFGALDNMATALGDSTAAKQWRTTSAQLQPLVIDSTTQALSFAAGLPYSESHRHFSHALAIHPLGLLTSESADSLTVQHTLDQIRQYGSDNWVGYSFSWYSAMLARAGRPEEALKQLEDYRRAFILRNGFHANGDQAHSGLAKATYRPVTLEGNFLALHAAHEMLLQSWDDVVRIFPAVSTRWRDVSYRDLRAEGGWRVSATRVGGVTTRVRIVSGAGGVLRLRDPFGGAKVAWNRRDVRRVGADYVVTLGKGTVLEGAR